MAKVGSGMSNKSTAVASMKPKPTAKGVRSTGDGGNLVTRLAKKGGGNKGKAYC